MASAYFLEYSGWYAYTKVPPKLAMTVTAVILIAVALVGVLVS